MKKYFLAILLMGAACLQASACDICGSSSSNSNPFLFPQLSKNFLSLGYTHRHYRQISNDTNVDQYFNTLLLTGQYSLGAKWQVLAQLPFQQNKTNDAAGLTHTSGLGDVVLLTNYKLLQRWRCGLRQTLTVGAGLKLPTGKQAFNAPDKEGDQNFQLGTGSLDFLLNSSYRLSYNRWTLQLMASYKYNQANRQGYRFGDLFSTKAMAAYRVELGSSYTLSPYVQVSRDQFMKDAHDHILQEETGGKALYTGFGADINSAKYALGVNYQVASQQQLSNGALKVRPGYSLRFSIIL